MELRADVGDTNDSSKAPRYLAVEKLSAHQNEKEWLFTGKRVKFKITNIILSGGTKSHRDELCVLNKIQNLLRNGQPVWNPDESETEVQLFREYCRLRNLRYIF